MSAKRKLQAYITSLRGNIAEIDNTARTTSRYDVRIAAKARLQSYRRCLRMMLEVREEMRRENDTRRTA